MIRPKDLKLGTFWDSPLERIKMAMHLFWENPPCRNYVRVQSDIVWLQVRCRLREITALRDIQPLSDFEQFLLHAAAYLYEIGWQADNPLKLSPAERYAASGLMLLASYSNTIGSSDFGVSGLDAATVRMLAHICEGVGRPDLAALPLRSQLIGSHETVHLRYLVALFQLADLLVINRAKKEYLKTVPAFSSTDDMANARLALHLYADFSFTNSRLTTHLNVHPDDALLIPKMKALLEEPIRHWLMSNWQWLATDYHLMLELGEPMLEILPKNSGVEPLLITCQALYPFLEAFQPCNYYIPVRSDLEKNNVPASSSIMRKRVYLEQKQREWNLLIEKIQRIREALIVELNPVAHLQYEQQLLKDESAQKRIEQELDEIERDLNSAGGV